MTTTPEKPAVGAIAIARDCFHGAINRRQAYRLKDDGWPVFKIGTLDAAYPSAIRAEAERRAQETMATARRAPSDERE